MNITKILEIVANSTHHNTNVVEQINAQPHQIKKILLEKDAPELQKQFSHSDYFANENRVFQL